MANIISSWRTDLQGTFSNNSPAVPQWQLDLAQGDDGGYFGPDSPAWAVHGSMTPIVGGIQALLIQALHPGALAGVLEHSNYKQDPLGRLAGTIRWIFTLTYADTATARTASNKVLAIHKHVRGNYTTNSGRERPYTANDPDLLRWVHLAFTQAFLGSHLAYGAPIPGGPDAYVADWAVAGALMQVDGPPTTVSGLQTQLAAFRPELRYDERVAETVAFIKKPPLPRSQQQGYKILFAGAVAALPPQYRDILGLEVPSLGPLKLPVRLATKAALGVVHAGLGPVGPSETAARARLARLG
ncbi:oxygenase MpaB family protein [Specibacter sp. NPDC057265]|uniref:oxygenase MpaB family protein n=1 Tax=Specibacter sp. NPDC057265 TaxID=3346075 RepID=UPI003624CC58